MTRWTARWGALATAALVAVGCGGSGGGKPHDGGPDGGGGDSSSAACMTGGSGMLKVVVTGLPAGATPMIQLKGGGISGSMVLSLDTPVTLDARGGYEIFYRRYKTAPAAGSAVGNAYYISESTFTGCIKDGETTTATLTYTKEPGSGKMFMSVANATPGDHLIAGFDGTDLVASGAKTPSVWKSKNYMGRAAAGAIDSFGNLWMPGGERINRYAMSSLATTSDAAPEVTLDQPANTAAKFAAFDSLGNLYVSRGAPGNTSAVVRYDAAQLETSGAPTPAVTITSPDMMNPAGLAFDDLGALWVASEGNDKVLRFTAAHAGASYAGPADTVITTKSGPTGVVAAYTSPIGLAFDMDKNLWVGYLSNLVKLTVAQQGASGDLTPFAITLSTGEGFAFDEGGGIWCPGPGIGSPSGQHAFQHIPAAMLAAGMATPDVTIDSAELGSVDTIVLDPAPTWSLIHDWM
jgi:sugar lactone lactonase YvrE